MVNPSSNLYGQAALTIQELLDHIPTPPDENCSCHISSPCNDCVDHSHLRMIIHDANSLINTLLMADLVAPNN